MSHGAACIALELPSTATNQILLTLIILPARCLPKLVKQPHTVAQQHTNVATHAAWHSESHDCTHCCAAKCRGHKDRRPKHAQRCRRAGQGIQQQCIQGFGHNRASAPLTWQWHASARYIVAGCALLAAKNEHKHPAQTAIGTACTTYKTLCRCSSIPKRNE